MAGIGFELKKIFTRGGIFNSVRGAFYASLTTIGPLIMIVGLLFSMYVFLDYSSISFAGRELMASTILYVFIFSLITTSPFNSVLSRYIADKIFDEKMDDILPSYYVGMFLNIGLSALMGIPFSLCEYFIGNVNPFYVFSSYCMYVTLAFSFFNMCYITALKEYKKITYSFLFGLSVAFIAAFIMVRVFHIALNEAIIYSFTIGFTLIAICLFAVVKSFFKVNSHNYRETFHYFRKFVPLFLVNLFYILGLYVHNFVFWTSHLQQITVKVFVSAPTYDLATCIAMFINIPTMVIFIVQVETDFHEKYAHYCEAIIGGTHRDILLHKKEMLKTLMYKFVFIFQFQLLINIILYLLCIIFLPRLGISSAVMDMLPSLTVAYFCVFLMYCLVVFMYYFEEIKGALITTALFFSITLVGSIICMLIAPPSFYGTGLCLGALIAMIYAYMKIRNTENRLEYHIFCRGNLIPREVMSALKEKES